MIDQAGYEMAAGGDIALARAQGMNDNMSKSHYHDYFELYYLEVGSRFHVVNDRLHHIQAPSVIIFPPYVMHHSYSDRNVPFKRVVLYFRPDSVLYPELLTRIGQRVNSYIPRATGRVEIDRLVAQLFTVQDEPCEYRAEELRLLLTELLIKLVRETPADTLVRRKQRMSEVISYLHEHHDEPITLESLSARFFISQYYLCREFKKFTNSTIVQYLNNVRIGRAQRLLNETNASVTEISKRVGFANVTHFNRVFKQATGMSPMASRRSAGAKRTGTAS